jgi:electron transport complex protein RnfG
MKLKDNENLIVLGLFLGAVGLLSALVLALVSYVTAKPIADAKIAQQRKAMSQVLPAFDNDPSQLVYETRTASNWQVKFMGAKKDGKLVAVAASAINPGGYGGDIEMLMGIAPDGKVLASLITRQSETPGLGVNVCARNFQKTIANLGKPRPAGLAPNKYLDQFNGLTAGDKEWKTRKDGGSCEYRTGATITSAAVIKLAYEIDRAYMLNKKEILSRMGGVK